MESFSPKTQDDLPCGTDPDSIASRLGTCYGNLHASSLKDVKIIITQNSVNWFARDESPMARGSDGNNNNNNNFSLPGPELPGQAEQQKPKIKYELPQDYQGTTSCTCQRLTRTYECGLCHHYLHGRLSQICEKHPSVVFLMDLRRCPYCMAQLELIKPSPLSWEDVRKIEDADLPSDTDI